MEIEDQFLFALKGYYIRLSNLLELLLISDVKLVEFACASQPIRREL